MSLIARARSSAPPAAILARSAYATLLEPALRAIDLNGDGVISADEIGAATGRACAWAVRRCEAAAALCQSTAASARRIKPVRALLDLTDADEWVVEQVKKVLGK